MYNTRTVSYDTMYEQCTQEKEAVELQCEALKKQVQSQKELQVQSQNEVNAGHPSTVSMMLLVVMHS